jgi:hypothetical protein
LVKEEYSLINRVIVKKSNSLIPAFTAWCQATSQQFALIIDCQMQFEAKEPPH